MGTEAMELNDAQAARWVWDSLWSTRRHARVDILDVAIFDEDEGAPPPTGIRWLFTAKDGRVMKKSSQSATLGALKQALLSRVFIRRGASAADRGGAANGRGSRSAGVRGTSAVAGCIFGTALLSSGESVPVDEAAWAVLVIRKAGRDGGAVAVTALTPAGGDSAAEAARRGGSTPQRFTCEYRAKSDRNAISTGKGLNASVAGGLPTTSTKTIGAAMTTFVKVSRGLLRDSTERIGEPQQEGEKENKVGATLRAAPVLSDERLVSRVKAINQEVEAKLRRIVQWVQEVRRVQVLSMTAAFTVLPSGSRVDMPRVWLEQALHVRMVPKDRPASRVAEATEPAPYADPCVTPRLLHCPSGREENSSTAVFSNSRLVAAYIPPPEEQDNGSATTEPLSGGVSSSPGENTMTNTAALPAPESGTTASPMPSFSSASPLGSKAQSTAEMLSAAADAVLSAGQTSAASSSTTSTAPVQAVEGVVVDVSQRRHRSDGDGDGKGSLQHLAAATAASVRQGDGRRSLFVGSGSEVTASAGSTYSPKVTHSFHEMCSGDFCAFENYKGRVRACSPERPAPEKRAPERNEGGRSGQVRNGGQAAVELDWTNIGVSDGKTSGAALLGFTNNRQLLPLAAAIEPEPSKGKAKDMLLTMTFKSIGLARVEAKQGLDAYWGEALRRCWRESRHGVMGDLEDLSPVVKYREVAVCQTCYEVYRRLDKGRETVNRTAEGGGHRGSSSTPSLLPSKGSHLMADIDATAAGSKRAAAEAGAATLRAEVAEMLKKMEAGAGKLGIEAGVLWRRRLSQSKRSSGDADLSTGRSQSLLTNKLSQPKDRHHLPQDCHVLPREGRTLRRPSLKRKVKSQGDIPDPAGDSGNIHYPRGHATASASGGGLPVLLSAQNHRRNSAARVSSPRTGLPHGAPWRSAWPPLNADDKAHVGNGHDGQERATWREASGNWGAGGGSDSRGGSSRVTLCAIEAMLEEGGGDRYLPVRALDLPEASAILGLRSPDHAEDDVRGAGHKKQQRRGAWRSTKDTGQGANRDIPGENNHSQARGKEHSRDATPETDSTGGSRRSDRGTNAGGKGSGRTPSAKSPVDGKGGRPEERFLHPWQRALEANKRAINTGREHEAALLKEQRRRRNSRRAAAESKDCRRAGRRVAARLGRQIGRRRSGRGGGRGKRDGKLSLDRLERGQQRVRLKNEECEGIAQARMHGGGYPRSCEIGHQCSGGNNADEADGGDEFLRQMHDSFDRAQNTFQALVKRLKDRGIDTEIVETTASGGGRSEAAKDSEILRVVNKLLRHLSAFNDKGITLGVEAGAAAAAGVAGATLLRSKCDAACESFEMDFSRLINELADTAKAHPNHPDLRFPPPSGDINERRSSCTSALFAHGTHPTDVPQTGGAGSGASAEAPRAINRSLNFALCPSCSVLPAARRCLDCDGDHTRDRCSSCFVREHRDANRRSHRFIRISGVGGEGGGNVDTVADNQHAIGTGSDGEKSGHAPGTAVRCSSCGDSAAAQRCLDGRIDSCAACHVLAHRSPSRRSHVKEFVGEAAACVQGAPHSRCRSIDASAAVCVGVDLKRKGGEGVVGGECGASAYVPGESSFGEDAAQSLVQVRRTIDAPEVPPPRQLQLSKGALSTLCGSSGDGDGAVGKGHANVDDLGVAQSTEDPSDEVDGGGEEGGGGATSLPRDDGEAAEDEETHEDVFEEADAGIPNRAGSPEDDIHGGTGRYCGGGGCWGQGGGGGENGDADIPEEIVRGEDENGNTAPATCNFSTIAGCNNRSNSRGGRGRGGRRSMDRTGDIFGGLEGIVEEEEEELGEEDSGTSSEEDTDDDEGMVWTPVNIGKVVLDPSDGEADRTSPPPTSRTIKTFGATDGVPGARWVQVGGGNSQAALTREATTPKTTVIEGADEGAKVGGGVERRDEDGRSPLSRTPTPRGEAAAAESREEGGGGERGRESPRQLLPQTGTSNGGTVAGGQHGESPPPPGTPQTAVSSGAFSSGKTDHQEVDSACLPPSREASPKIAKNVADAEVSGVDGPEESGSSLSTPRAAAPRTGLPRVA